jgi:radical SAM superfamily enzyme YgiQ (UPF0313 family)
VEDVKYIIKAAKAGLEPHVAVMFGYPWETDSDAVATLRLVWWLLKKGYAKTAQASVYNPGGDYYQRMYGIEYDGWDEYKLGKYVKRIYDVKWSPQFWFNQLRDIKNIDDIKYLWRKIKAGINDKCLHTGV